MSVFNAKENPSPFPPVTRFSVGTGGRTAGVGGRAASLPAAGDVVANGAPARPQSTVVYPQPRYGVLRPEGVNQVLAYHSLGTYPDSSGSPPIEADVVYDRHGEPTLLPIPPRGGATTPSTPGYAFAGMSIGSQHTAPAAGENVIGLHLLADAADVN